MKMVGLKLMRRDDGNGCRYSILSIRAATLVLSCLLLLVLLLASFMGVQKMQPPLTGSSINNQIDHHLTLRRKNCQVVYIMGVEGVTHHGVFPIIEALAKQQVDPESGHQYHVVLHSKHLRAGLFGFYSNISRRWGFPVTPEIDDPLFVQQVVRAICPDDGNKHVIIESVSFPSGRENNQDDYRGISRQDDWQRMSPHNISNSIEALQQPMNVTAFVEAYSPYVDIKFVVIH